MFPNPRAPRRAAKAPMFPFDVILFDVGGVLLTNGWDRQERAAAAAEFGLDPLEFEARHAEVYDAWERDAISGKAYLNATVFHEPRPFSRGKFFSFVLGQSKLLPDGALEILKQLAAQGNCLLGALNNEARETNAYRFRTFGLRAYFDVAFSSCYMGLRKPEPAMYARALDILGRPPERVLFIDDRAENVAGAEKAGMQALRFTGAEALRQELARRGVL